MKAWSYTIGVVTYRRPILLGRLLASLERQAWRELGAERYEILVVDNDAQGSAKDVVSAYAERCPVALRYEVSTPRSIARARNTALALAKHPFLVFLDDDQTVDEHFLKEIDAGWPRFARDHAGAVLACRYRLEQPHPRSCITESSFPHRRYPDGSPLDRRHGRAGSGGLIIARERFAGETAPFPERFGLTGGEDSHFFLTARARGERFVHLARPCVTELVPAERATARYLLRLRFRDALLLPEIERRRVLVDGTVAVPRIARVAINATRLVAYMPLLLVAPLFGRRFVLATALAVVGAAGKILGAFGGHWQFYRHSMGDVS